MKQQGVLCRGPGDVTCMIPVESTSPDPPPPSLRSLSSTVARVERGRVRKGFSLCQTGLRKGPLCCAAACDVCGGPYCSGLCCGGAIKKIGVCKTSKDVNCLIPEPQVARYAPGASHAMTSMMKAQQDARGALVAPIPLPPGTNKHSRSRLCEHGIRNGEVCCAASCKVCGGPFCSGKCCGGYMKELGALCMSPMDVSCLLPKSIPGGSQALSVQVAESEAFGGSYNMPLLRIHLPCQARCLLITADPA